MDILLELVKDAIHTFVYWIKTSLRPLAKLLNVLLPYLMYFIGQYVCNERGNIVIGSEIFVPITVCVIIYFIRSYANKIGKGTTIPTPHQRFTSVDDNDEVTIENSRIQELILYTADLEDWLERKGLL